MKNFTPAPLQRQLAEKINITSSGALIFRTILTCEQRKFLIQNVDFYNGNLKSSCHFFIFLQNNLSLTCTFCKLEEKAQNFHAPFGKHTTQEKP